MKKNLFIIVAVLLSLFCGCRREDWREFTVTIPGLKEALTNDVVYAEAQAKIESSLSVYEGIPRFGIRWNETDKTRLTVKFDSLLIAEMNIVKAIEKAGYAVTYPTLIPGAPAGYINSRKKEVEPPKAK